MATDLNIVELDITKEIINIGLSKSADSLSFFIKEKVFIKMIDLRTGSGDFMPLSVKDSVGKCYLLTTEIKGSMGGKAFLIFNESEVEKIVEANMPDSIKNNPVERANMANAFLLEIDNIITASVITQFANILHCKIYGGVPSLDILPHEELNDFLAKGSSAELNAIYFNSKFITKNLDIDPEFIWLLDDQFFSEVKALVGDEKKLELIRSLHGRL